MVTSFRLIKELWIFIIRTFINTVKERRYRNLFRLLNITTSTIIRIFYMILHIVCICSFPLYKFPNISLQPTNQKRLNIIYKIIPIKINTSKLNILCNKHSYVLCFIINLRIFIELRNQYMYFEKFFNFSLGNFKVTQCNFHLTILYKDYFR